MKKKFAFCVFVDFTKAFDTINHAILFRKLEKYGIRGIVLELIRDYLSNRSQVVKIKDTLSSSRLISIGIPQGSILGPLWFILYINDLPKFSNSCHSILHADGTTLCFRGDSLSNVRQICIEELDRFCVWVNSNKLTTNFTKTFKEIATKNRYDKINIPSLSGESYEHIKFVSTCKFLGLNFDSDLKFKSHINHVCRKISKSIGIRNKLKNYLDSDALISLYYSIIYPYVIYCNLIWGNTFKSKLQPIFILQKRAIRIIRKVGYLAHTNVLFSNN